MKHARIPSFFKNYKEGDIIKINPAEIQKIPELQNVFRIDLDVKDRIKDDMRINGFSKAHPVHVFKWVIDGKEVFVLCDGYTRYTAASELCISSIYAQVHIFQSINEAVLYSMKEQFNRRNIQDCELFKNFEILRKQEIDGRKLTATEMSERLKKSKRHIFKLQEVFAKSSKEQLNSIRNGEVSINQVYNDIKKEENLQLEREKEEVLKNEKVITENDASNLKEELSEAELEQNIQNTIQNKLQQKQRELEDKELELKQKEAILSSKLTDKQILLIGAKCALILQARGKTTKEILSGNSFSDSVKASEIRFKEEDLALIKAI